jgi:alkyl hydroperoxide reductase subunit AhpC
MLYSVIENKSFTCNSDLKNNSISSIETQKHRNTLFSNNWMGGAERLKPPARGYSLAMQ